MCVIISASACSEQTQTTTAAADTVTAPSETEETTEAKPYKEEKTVTMTSEGYTTEPVVTTSEPASESYEEISEQFTPAYDPVLSAYISMVTTEITADTEEITFSVNTETGLETGSDFVFQHYNGEAWETLQLIDGAFIADDSNIITPDSPLIISFNISDYGINLVEGDEYRILKNINGKDYETYFTVSYPYIPLMKEDIKITVEGGNIFTTEDEKLILEYRYVGNAKGIEYGFGCEYELEHKTTDGSWETVLFSENASFIELGYLIGPDCPYNATTVSLSDDFYAAPLLPGEYRVIKKVEDLTYYIDFTVVDSSETAESADTNDIILSKEDVATDYPKGNEFTVNDEEFPVVAEYIGKDSNAEFTTDYNYSLEKKNQKGEWEKVPFRNDVAFVDIGIVFGADNKIFKQTFSLNDERTYKEDLTPGEYRIIKDFSGTAIEFPFIITEEKEPEYEIFSESGSITLTINSITEKSFICSLPWPYPADYTVECNTADYEEFCVGDNIEVSYDMIRKYDEWDYRITPTAIIMSDFELQEGLDYKPVIYLYPKEETRVSVKLDYNGELTVTYPEYGDGWNVTAMPDGTLYDENGNEYSYLFWEGKSNIEYDFSKGFCVKGEDTAEFLRSALSSLGLTAREYNEFIVFWLPHMMNNKYNIISFQTDCYTDNAVLSVSPEPDTVLRVFMAYKPSNKPVEIEKQVLTSTERKGFTVIEWGGTIAK